MNSAPFIPILTTLSGRNSACVCRVKPGKSTHRYSVVNDQQSMRGVLPLDDRGQSPQWGFEPQFPLAGGAYGSRTRTVSVRARRSTVTTNAPVTYYSHYQPENTELLPKQKTRQCLLGSLRVSCPYMESVYGMRPRGALPSGRIASACLGSASFVIVCRIAFISLVPSPLQTSQGLYTPTCEKQQIFFFSLLPPEPTATSPMS